MEKLALKLMDDIQKRTHEQLQILEENFHTQRESQINQFNQEAVEESNLYIEQELAELKSSVMQSETQLKWKIKKNLFIRREELVEGLFEQLRDKLCAYSKTEAYLYHRSAVAPGRRSSDADARRLHRCRPDCPGAGLRLGNRARANDPSVRHVPGSDHLHGHPAQLRRLHLL